MYFEELDKDDHDELVQEKIYYLKLLISFLTIP